jgi:hypothetical protein
MRPILALVAAAFALASCGPSGRTYGDGGRASSAALQQLWFADGGWKLCLAAGCPSAKSGSGAAALTFAAYFAWMPQNGGDASYAPLMDKIGASIPVPAAPCVDSTCRVRSDVPMWNAVALLRTYDKNERVNPGLEKASSVLDSFDRSSAYFKGACPEIPYLEPFGGKSKLKALATDSNYAKAALSVAHYTGKDVYLDRGERRYLAARKYYFDPKAGLYTAYLIDDGKHCTQVPHRFLASVNGNMIYSAYVLFASQRGTVYQQQASGVARTAVAKLSDARGVLANLQDEDDTADPLFEAMFVLANYWNMDFARAWIARNAAAAEGARREDGSIGRFLDGPPPAGGVTAWQTSGGFAATLAAQALQPGEVLPSPGPGWKTAKFVRLGAQTTPQTIRFTGSGIALRGTLGDPCCPGGARVFIDGVETFDHTGIRQSYSPAGKIPNAILFAWQWPVAGKHEIKLEADSPAGAAQAAHLSGYEVK